MCVCAAVSVMSVIYIDLIVKLKSFSLLGVLGGVIGAVHMQGEMIEFPPMFTNSRILLHIAG